MLRAIIKIFLFSPVLLFTQSLYSQMVVKHLVVRAEYEPEGLRRRIPEEARLKVEAKARTEGFALYLSENTTVAQQNLINNIRDEVNQNLNKIIPNVTILDERENRERRLLEASVRVEIDTSQIERLIAASIDTPDEEDLIVFLFVARRIAAITTSDGKRTSFIRERRQEDEREGLDAQGSSLETVYASDNLVVKEYGGKNIDKAQRVEWVAEPVASVDAAVNEVFTQAGFFPVDPNDVDGFEVGAFRQDYEAGDDIKPQTRRDANSLLRDYEVAYFATGRMDITLPDIHPVTGLTRVFVRVEARMTDLSARLPRTVASVAGEYYQGVGPNVEVATQNALLTASRDASSKLVNQMRARAR